MATIRQLIDQADQAHPDKVFLFAPETQAELRYGQLQSLAQEIAAYLNALDIQKGEKVAFLLPNGYWTTVLLLAIAYSGRVVVPLNAVSGDTTLSHVITHSDAKAIFCDAQLKHKYAQVFAELPESIQLIDADADHGIHWPDGLAPQDQPLPPIHQQDDAILMYTSGTTGKPKGVLLSHRNCIAGGDNTRVAHQLTADDRALCVLPLYHINAQMVTVMAPLVSSGSVVMPSKFSTSEFWSLLAQYGCSWFSVVPTIIAYLLEQAEREGFDRDVLGGLPRLRFGRSASSPLAPEIHKDFESTFGVSIIETMGLTETAAQILANPMPPAKTKYGSPGIAFGNEIKVIDEQGKPCPVGISGELMIRGANVTKGYYKNPQATEAALEPDGWLHTGDIAKQDKDGFLFITGRIKELIIKGGENIAPREIDEALCEHPAVLEAAGFGVPDARYGQEIMACVALKPGTDCSEKELTKLLESRLGKFKKPKRIFFMPGLPKGPSGKIQRLKLPEVIPQLTRQAA